VLVLFGAAVAAAVAALWTVSLAQAYPWPLKPFDKAHALRGAFDDPRFHLGAEGELSAFHFGVDIAARDGTPVYAVARGRVRARKTDITVRGRNGRAFGYWHVRPVVHTGQRVRKHQLLGYVLKGWGHVHFAEAVWGQYRNPLRPRALTPYRDKLPPTVAAIALSSSERSVVATSGVRGLVDIQAEVYDTPPVAPRPPWQVARLTPAFIWWRIVGAPSPAGDWNLAVDFHYALMPSSLYGWIYAPGTYQNKANRPGHYVFWLAHDFDTSSLADGRYQIEVDAEDTRGNVGTGTLDFTVANGEPPVAPSIVPAMRNAR
jgi:hypothetical protein